MKLDKREESQQASKQGLQINYEARRFGVEVS